MSLKLTLAATLLIITVFIMSCQPSEPFQNGNAADSPTDSKPTSAATSSATPCPAPSLDANRKIILTAPCDGTRVNQRDFAEGIISDPNAHVVVVVHTMEVADFWVQPSVTVREGGKWKVLCYFGEPGPQHSGKHYEVMALVNPKEKLREGQLLSGWPEAESKSQVIEVVRQ